MNVEKHSTGVEIRVILTESEAALLARYMLDAILFDSPGGKLAEALYDEITGAGVEASDEFTPARNAGLVAFE